MELVLAVLDCWSALLHHPSVRGCTRPYVHLSGNCGRARLVCNGRLTAPPEFASDITAPEMYAVQAHNVTGRVRVVLLRLRLEWV